MPDGPTPRASARQDQIDAAAVATRTLAARIERDEGAVLLDDHTTPRVGALFAALGDSRRLAVCEHLNARHVQPSVTVTPRLLVCADCHLEAAARVRVDPDADCPACSAPRTLPRGPLRPVIATFGLIIAHAVLCGVCLSREQYHAIERESPRD